MSPEVGAADSTGLAAAVEVLLAGGVVAFPTDTVYALGVNPRDESALQRLFKLKGRPRTTVTPLAAANAEQVTEIAEVSAAAWRLGQVFWPGGLTLVLPARTTLPPGSVNPRGGIGLRVPDHDFARSLASHLGFPVTASSANVTGHEPVVTAMQARASLPAVDLVIDGGRSAGVASSVLDLSGDQPTLVRDGIIARARLEQVLEAPIRVAPSPIES
jgi:L-threonylcarbamoyladenylate synthase